MVKSTKTNEANKSNARYPTGPNDTSSTRLNALAHGILSKEVVIGHGNDRENADDFESLKSAITTDIAPVGALEEVLVDQLVTMSWRWRRVIKYETAAIRRESSESDDDDDSFSDLDDPEFIPGLASLPDDQSINKIQRYEAHISRQFYKALHELQRLQAARLSGRVQVPLAVDIDVSVPE